MALGLHYISIHPPQLLAALVKQGFLLEIQWLRTRPFADYARGGVLFAYTTESKRGGLAVTGCRVFLAFGEV